MHPAVFFTLGLDHLSVKRFLASYQSSDRYARRARKVRARIRPRELSPVDETRCAALSEARDQLCRVIADLNEKKAKSMDRVAAERNYFDQLAEVQESGFHCHRASQNFPDCPVKHELSFDEIFQVTEQDFLEANSEREMLLAERATSQGLKVVNPKTVEAFAKVREDFTFFKKSIKVIQMVRAWLVAKAVTVEDRWIEFVRREALARAERLLKLQEPPSEPKPMHPRWRP